MTPSTFQMPCPQCRTSIWVTAGSTTQCPHCRAPLATAVAQASVQAPSGFSNLPAFGAVMGNAHGKMLANAGGSPRKKVFLGIAGAVAIAIAGIAVTVVKRRLGGNTAKGNLSYSSLGVDMKQADPDRMIASLEAPAKRWSRDAVWWAINVQALRADGTMDLSNGGAVVTYMSPSRVASHAKTTRQDSIKEFSFGPSGVSWNRIVGATKPWENVVLPVLPGCTFKKLAGVLRERGLGAGKTVRVTFDPQFNRMAGTPVQDSWRVVGEDPKLDAWFSMVDCAPTK